MTDRFNLMHRLRGNSTGHLEFDVQDAMDRYTAYTATGNACKGGDPVAFLRWANGQMSTDKTPYRAVACQSDVTRNGPNFDSVSRLDFFSISQLKTRLATHGPILMGIDATVLTDKDFKGVVQRKQGRIDHIVCVVGWIWHAGTDCWIVRNTWGRNKSAAQAQAPRNMSCLTTCELAECAKNLTMYWEGLPNRKGYFYLPVDLALYGRYVWADAVPSGFPGAQ